MVYNLPADLQRYIYEKIIPQYVNFDKAHQVDHVEYVIEESLKPAASYLWENSS